MAQRASNSASLKVCGAIVRRLGSDTGWRLIAGSRLERLYIEMQLKVPFNLALPKDADAIGGSVLLFHF